jgi:hypothetical protein
MNNENIELSTPTRPSPAERVGETFYLRIKTGKHIIRIMFEILVIEI